MDIASLPFNRLIGLEVAPSGSDWLVALPADPRYGNHLGTVHGSALLAVAEAGSGEFLRRNFPHQVGAVPVVRRVEAKFRRPASGRVSSRCLASEADVAGWLSELQARGRVSADILMEVLDESGTLVMTARLEWFIVIGKA